MNFNFLNIPVVIQPSFWLFLCFFCYNPGSSLQQMAILALVFGFSLLFHEYGHALAVKKMGGSPEITLESVGGYVSYQSRGLSEKQQFIITSCGPLFTMFLIAASYYLLYDHLFSSSAILYFLYCTMKLNTYWLIVNLSPLSPLDGGKMMEYFLKKIFKEERGHYLSLLLGNMVAVGGVAYFVSQQSYMFAYIFFFYGLKNFQHTRLYATQKPSDFQIYQQALASEKTETAKALLKKLIRSKDEPLKIRACETLAELLEQDGEEKKAYDLLLSLDPSQLTKGKWQLCKLAYAQKNDALIARFAREIYTERPMFETAILNAKTFSRLGDLDYAFGWLNTALQFDEANNFPLDRLLEDPAFLSLQSHLEFKKLFEARSAKPVETAVLD